MNIKGKHYCSKCLKPISDEILCPFCGHNPETLFDSHLMEEGTLLADQRYRIGVIIKEDPMFCYYGGWDYCSEEPVIIHELFPKYLVSRNVLVSDTVLVSPEKKSEYDEMLHQFLDFPNDSSQLHSTRDFFCVMVLDIIYLIAVPILIFYKIALEALANVY